MSGGATTEKSDDIAKEWETRVFDSIPIEHHVTGELYRYVFVEFSWFNKFCSSNVGLDELCDKIMKIGEKIKKEYELGGM